MSEKAAPAGYAGRKIPVWKLTNSGNMTTTIHIQKLVAIHHLCGMCHKIKHIGRSCYTKEGQRELLEEGLTRDDLIEHFCRVNRCTDTDFMALEAVAFAIWKERSRHKWKQDLGRYDPNL